MISIVRSATPLPRIEVWNPADWSSWCYSREEYFGPRSIVDVIGVWVPFGEIVRGLCESSFFEGCEMEVRGMFPFDEFQIFITTSLGVRYRVGQIKIFTEGRPFSRFYVGVDCPRSFMGDDVFVRCARETVSMQAALREILSVVRRVVEGL